MRTIKYYSKKTIKYLFGAVILAVLILIPAMTLVQQADDESGLDIIDNLNVLPSLSPTIKYENGQNYDEHGYGADVVLTYDEAKYNGYNPTDYLIVVTKSPIESGYLVDENDPMYWAPNYTTLDEVSSSVAYSKLMKNNVSVDAPPGATESEIEELQQEKIKNHILNNTNQFINDGSSLFTMYESNFTWTLESVARFEKESDSGSILTQEVESGPVSITVTKDEGFRISDEEVIVTPDITFDSSLQQISTETNSLGGTNQVISRFIFDGDPTGEIGEYSKNGLSTFTMFTNTLAPRFRISADELMYLDIFEKVPTIDLTLYLSDNDDASNTTDDIKVIELSQEMTDWQLKNKVMILEPTYIGGLDGVYDETNTLVKPIIKFKASLSYEYKTEEDILKIHPNAVLPSYPVSPSATHEMGTDDNMMCVQKDDLNVFQGQAEFDRSEPPRVVAYQNWDLNGKFNVVFATKDPYIFESSQFDASKFTSFMVFSIVDDETGQVIEMEVSFSDIKKTVIDGETVYYAQKYPANSISENRTYYYSSLTELYEKNTYTSNAKYSANSFKPGETFSGTLSRRHYFYDSFSFVEDDEISVHDDFEGVTIVTSQNFHEAANHEAPNYFKILISLAIIFSILVILPIVLYLLLVSKRKLTERE